MLFHRPTQMAFNASLYLALQTEGIACSVREIAVALGVPAPYLSKVLRDLLRSRLLRSVRGPGGGMQLARAAREIYPWEVLSAIDPLDRFESCILGLHNCSERTPCPLHELWAPTRASILHRLQTKNLWEFAVEAQRSGAVSGGQGQTNGSRGE